MSSVHLLREALVTERIQESPTVLTLGLRYTEPAAMAAFGFEPGQFNMVYQQGAGEVPLSIASDPDERDHFAHTLRVVGRVTRALERLGPGDRVGVRGPFGRGWPLEQAEGSDLALITGGLGCTPMLSVINYVMRRRARYGRLFILQGVRHVDDMIWRERYQDWSRAPDTQVLLAADITAGAEGFLPGTVVDLFAGLDMDPACTIALLCGPEVMMLAAIAQLRERGLEDERIWLSLERNMGCGVGLCGHCQIGPRFVCRDGPVFCYAEIADLFGARGF